LNFLERRDELSTQKIKKDYVYGAGVAIFSKQFEGILKRKHFFSSYLFFLD